MRALRCSPEYIRVCARKAFYAAEYNGILKGSDMIRAYVMIKVGAGEYYGVEKTIKEKVRKLPGVIKVESIFGRFDIIVEVEAEKPNELSSLVIDKIKGIQSVVSTETFVCH
jgi:DNA-binding Lrp family transcriptional regulator